MNKNYGLNIDLIKIEPDHYTMLGGQLPFEELQPDGQWDAFLPEFEPQSKQFETFNCTAFATDNAEEVLMLRKFNLQVNNSDRALGIAAGTGAEGNSPHVVAEAKRTLPCTIPEFRLPFSDDLETIEQYYSPRPLTPYLQAIGQEYLNNFTFGHDWIFSPSDLVSQSVENKVKLMKSALRSSPICVSVPAWYKNDQGIYYKPEGVTDNHWCMCYGWNDQGWKFYDSYDNDHKILSFDIDFMFAKRYSITRKDPTAPQKSSFWQWLIALIKKVVR